GGGASEASQKTTLGPRRPVRPAPPRPFVPRPQQAGGEIERGQSDVTPVERQRQGALTMTSQGILPRGAAAERGSTAGGGEGARAKRARKPPCGPGGRSGPRPLGTSCRSPSKLGEKSQEASPTAPPGAGRARGHCR